MFFLLMVLFGAVPGLDRVYVLNTFGTAEECQTERNRIGFEMAEAYPYDMDFIIVCELDKRKVKLTWATEKPEHLGS
jgi:hypothetical protein